MFILGCFAVLLTRAWALDLLPGIDEISAGYDAAKMLSASEQNSKYRIFDLSDLSERSYQVRSLGTTRRFAVPKLVQVTDISTRREDSCQTVAYSFESFYHSYFRSVSFGIGIGTPGVASLSIGYSKTLKTINEAITKSEKAVGISTIWWGQYSIQLAPPFLLKLDPIFIETVNLLASEAPNPSNDDQQSYYNQFVQTYGTHYVSRAIVGGTANLYSIIDSNFHKKSSYREITQQVSVSFTYEQSTGQYGQASGSVFQTIKETFKSNTATLSVFRPPVTVENNESEWKVWQRVAGEQPVVVNRTLFSIHDLIRNKPTVREHLRKTIQYYLKTGMMPTYEQLGNPLAGRSTKTIRAQSLGPINGLNVVGCGYHLLTMQNKFCLLDQSNFTEGEQWSDPLNRSLTYSIPNGWFVVNTPDSSVIDGSFPITSIQNYFRRTTGISLPNHQISAGFDRKYAERTISDIYRRFYQENYNLVLRLKQIAWYTLAVRAFPYPTLSNVTQTAIDRLPTEFSTNNLKIWREFFDIFGTHVVVSSTMGGQVRVDIWYDRCLTRERTEQWISEQIRNTWLFYVRSSQSNQQNVSDDFRRNSHVSAHVVGGNRTISLLQWDQWMATVKDDPFPLSYELVSLDELLPQGSQRIAMKQAIDYLLQRAEKQDQTYINELEKRRLPPKNTCSSRGSRTRRHNSKGNRQ